jgi:tetratricopeptide (TPR) repeat protein
MDEAIAYDHDNSRLYRIRADYKFEIEQRLAARADIDKAIEKDPNDPLNYDSRGTMKLFMEDFTGAFRDFTRAIDLAPENEKHYRKRAYAYYNSGRYELAITDLSNTIELVLYRLETNTISREDASSLLSNTYLIRGSALTQVDNYVEACSDFKMARDLGSRKAVNYISRYCR